MSTARIACGPRARVSPSASRRARGRLPNSFGAALWAAWLCWPLAAEAQGTRADYERSAARRRRTEGTVFKARVAPQWDADGNRFWYRNDLPGGRREAAGQ